MARSVLVDARLLLTAFAAAGLLAGVAACSHHDASTAAPSTPAASSSPGASTSTADGAAPPVVLPPSGRRLGAVVDGDGVIFRVWAPAVTAAWVEGEVASDRVAMHVEADLWVARIAGAHAGQTYRYAFESAGGTIERLDPYCRQLDNGACTIVDATTYAWHSPTFARPARNASVAYEMHVGGFTSDGAAHGTFASARAALPRLADLGVNVVEMMPIQDFGGGASGWGYDPQLFFAPKATYGTADDLRALVDDGHASGIGFWLDVVYNHNDGYSQAPLVCFDGNCAAGGAGVYFFPPGPYAKTPWGPRLDFATKQVADMILDSVDEWLTAYRGDGFRWDSVSNIRALDGQGTVPGGSDLLVRANDWTHALGASSVAEDLKGNALITASTTSSGGFGFDAQWDGFGGTVSSVLVPFTDATRDLGQIQAALTGGGADPFARLIYLETHDSVGNGGSRFPVQIDSANPESIAARKRSMLGAVLLLSAPGVPMLFMGQEDLATSGFTDPPAPLPAVTPRGAMIHAFYKDMIALRRNLGGGSGGLLDTGVDVLHRNDSTKVIAYRRSGASGEDVIVVLNLKNTAYTTYDIGVPSAGPWKVRLDGDSKTYGDDFGGGTSGAITATATPRDGQSFTLSVPLAAYDALVLSR